MPLSRRRFLTTAALATLGFPALVRARNLNSRLQVVTVGCDGKGFDDIKEIGSHPGVQYVGFCDIDAGRFGHAAAAYPGVPHHADFRAMFAQLGERFDAAVVSTPDHMHALPALTAMRMQKHVYLQKPLAHSIEEARRLRLEAAQHGVRTQMGNQIHSRSEYRTAVRLIQEGRIGKVLATHSWLTNKGNGYTKLTTRPAAGPVPPGLAWDLWLGVAAARPYAPTVYHPFNWRDWLDFGNGTLGDFGCHLLDPIFTALKLGAPTHVRAESTGLNPETWCEQETVHWTFPATPFTTAEGVTVHWYDGGRLPDPALAHLPPGRSLPTNGSIFVGEQGSLVLPHVGMPALYPEETFGLNLSPGELSRRQRRLDAGEKDDRAVAAIKPADHRNHYHDWVDAAMQGHETTANFAYAGPLTEAVLLGTVAARFSGQRLKWDAPGLRIANHAGADAFVRKAYRDGWKP